MQHTRELQKREKVNALLLIHTILVQLVFRCIGKITLFTKPEQD